MKKFLFLLTLILLAACGHNENEQSEKGEVEVYPLEVDLQVPEQGETNQEISLKAMVTYGDEKVENANEVQFEVWKDGEKEKSEIVEAPHVGNGIYEISYTFKEDGIYFVQSHVTAKDQHNMPKKQIIIGSKTGEEHGGHSELNNHHHGKVEMELFIDKQILVNQKTTLKANITKNDAPISNASVHFEVWKEDSHDHEWIETNEISKGFYEGSFTFKESGKYFVQIHVKKNGLHEHLKQIVDVP